MENEGVLDLKTGKDEKLTAEQQEEIKKQEAEAARIKEVFKATNSIIMEELKILKEKHGLNVVMIAELENENQVGVWKTEDMNYTKEVGLMSLIQRKVLLGG